MIVINILKKNFTSPLFSLLVSTLRKTKKFTIPKNLRCLRHCKKTTQNRSQVKSLRILTKLCIHVAMNYLNGDGTFFFPTLRKWLINWSNVTHNAAVYRLWFCHYLTSVNTLLILVLALTLIMHLHCCVSLAWRL